MSTPSHPPGCSSSVPVLLRARRRAQRCRRLTPETRVSLQENQGIAHIVSKPPEDPKYPECHCWAHAPSPSPLTFQSTPELNPHSPLRIGLCLSHLTWGRALAQGKLVIYWRDPDKTALFQNLSLWQVPVRAGPHAPSCPRAFAHVVPSA